MWSRDSERDLLVLAVRAPSASRDRALAAALAVPLDWERLLDLAYVHGCIPLLASVLTAAPQRHAVPEPILRRLSALAGALALRCQVSVAACASILDALAPRGITPVLLKGPALAVSLYPHPDLRPFQDLDLLLRSVGEADAAGAVLQQMEYVRCERDPVEMDGFHTVYALPAQSVTVELHTDLLQLGLPMRTASAVWYSRETITIASRQAATLGLEYQILHLCVHLHTHGYGRLIWLKDLDLLLRKRGAAADWERLWRLAKTEGVTLSVRHALTATRDLLDTPLPGAALRRHTWDVSGEVAHRLLWPHQRTLALRGKQRLRSVRFNPRLGSTGVIPSLVVMGRRKEKLRTWLWPSARRAPAAPADNVVKPDYSMPANGVTSDEKTVLST